MVVALASFEKDSSTYEGVITGISTITLRAGRASLVPLEARMQNTGSFKIKQETHFNLFWKQRGKRERRMAIYRDGGRRGSKSIEDLQ